MTVEAAEVDVAIIGGGINGTGAARDLALRGLKVLLLEKTDLGAGATGASSGMIHGGARYLAHEPAVTKIACADAGVIRRIAAPMIFRIPFIFPFSKDHHLRHLPPWLSLHLTDAMFVAYDRYQPLKGGCRHQRLTPQEALELEPGLRPDIVGAVTWDEWGCDAARLCVANAIAAHEAGASLRTYCRVVELLRDDGGKLRGVHAIDEITGDHLEVRARAVLNATGPWGDLLTRDIGPAVRLRPTKGVHLVIGGRVTSYAIAILAVDGRVVFLEPWQGVTLIGTTDDDYYGDLDALEATTEEVGYLLEAVESVFPSIRRHRVIDTWVGVRPTLWQYGPSEERLTREHLVVDHAVEGAEGFFTVAGGKLATFRQMVEEAADAICRYLGEGAPCRTAELPLPGAKDDVDVRLWSVELDVPEAVLHTLARRYGSRTPEVFEATPVSRKAAVLCRCAQVLEVEVRQAVRREWAKTLEDVMRRTRLGTGQCGGTRCAHRAAQLLGEELGLGGRWAAREAERFLANRYRSRRPALDGFHARSEALRGSFLAMHLSPGSERGNS